MPILALRNARTTNSYPIARDETRDVATEVYHNAVALLKAERGIDPNVPVPLESLASISEVCATVEKARHSYMNATAKHTGARKWLEKLSSRIMYYTPVFDALAQHHPEYVALAWGAVKFVLTGIINRATLIEELSRALVTIGDLLPRAHLSVELYQSPDMESALARLYACIILFFQLCVQWYNKSSWGRLWSSVKDPFELKYKDLIADIELCSTLVENLANAGARVEIRDIHALSELEHSRLVEIDAKVDKVFEAQMNELKEINLNVVKLFDRQTKLEDQMTQMIRIATSSKSSIEQMNGDVRQMSERVYRLEFHQVIGFFMPKITPDNALLKTQALARRNPTLSLPTHENLKMENAIRDWVSKVGASFLILQTGPRAQRKATELAAEVINHLRKSSQCVFWYISPNLQPERTASMTDVFKTIIFQALQHSGNLFTQFAEQLNLAKIQGSHTEREWVDLACLLLSKIPKAFIIIETGDVQKMYRHDRTWSERFLELCQIIIDRTSTCGCQLKILIILYGVKTTATLDQPKNNNLVVASLQPSTPVPPRLRHLAGRSGLNTKGWKLQKSED